MRKAHAGVGVAVGIAVWALLGMAAGARAEGEKVRHVTSLDAEWRFNLGDVAGAEAVGFADAAWRQLDVPHDWSIEGMLDNQAAGPAGAFLPGGIGWYRKTFTTPAGAGEGAGKKVFVEFDGVMQDSRVWINGELLGRRPYAYATFRYDVTDKLKAGGANTLAVRADCSVMPVARWYAGGGIYRHVRMIVTDPVHTGQWATFITTPEVTAEKATVRVETSVVNESTAEKEVDLQIEIAGPDGKPVKTEATAPQKIAAGEEATYARDIEVDKPALWDFDAPNLYTATVRVRAGGTVVDDEVTRFGVRHIEFKPETGFWINGRNTKLYGTCLHNDGGGVGSAAPMGVWERRLALLKKAGVNAIRTAHNAPDPEFLKLCDRMGFAVMHELFDAWAGAKTRGDYARFFNEWAERDLADVVARDRNHPSIVIYSAGNEIRDSAAQQKVILRKLLDIYHRVDPTRPVTQALFRPENPGGAYTNGQAAMLDVVGTNYRPEALVQYQKQHPEAKVIGTEDNYNAAELRTLRDAPSLAGEFLWTGIDYLGEGMGRSIAQGFGLIDRTNAPRLRYFERQSWWTTTPMVKIGRVLEGRAPVMGDTGGGRVLDWTPVSGGQQTVEVYSNCEEVELFLNGNSLGSKARPASWQARVWRVSWAPGTLRAVARNKGQEAAIDEIRSAGKATKVMVEADQKTLTAAWDEVCYVRVRVTDEAGVTNPNSSDKVTFAISGPGRIMAVDNADLASREMFRGTARSAYRGECIAVIKATGAGPITVKAGAEGLGEAAVTIEGKP